MKHHSTTHGQSSTRLYSRWANMLDRVLNPRSKDYPAYGGRGITVDPRWMKFENFFVDMGSTFEPSLSLNRKDNDGPYTKTNCEWTTSDKQQQNRRCSKTLIFDGKEENIEAFARTHGFVPSTIRRRINAGWRTDKLLIPPAHHNKRGWQKRPDEMAAAKLNGISWNTVRGRLKHGWSMQDAVTLTVKKVDPKLRAAAKKCHVSVDAIRNRLRRGWDINKALSTSCVRK